MSVRKLFITTILVFITSVAAPTKRPQIGC